MYPGRDARSGGAGVRRGQELPERAGMPAARAQGGRGVAGAESRGAGCGDAGP